MTARAKFRTAATTNAIRAARAAGLETFDIIPGPDGEPIIRARPANDTGTPQDVLDELREWAREA
jgi:hypothetical protein